MCQRVLGGPCEGGLICSWLEKVKLERELEDAFPSRNCHKVQASHWSVGLDQSRDHASLYSVRHLHVCGLIADAIN